MKINYMLRIKILLLLAFSSSATIAHEININSLRDIDIFQHGDRSGFLEEKTNLTWLDIGVLPTDFIEATINKTTSSYPSKFSGWRIANQAEIAHLLKSIFPESMLGSIGGSWGGTSLESLAFHEIVTIMGINETIPNYEELYLDSKIYEGWRANASFIGEDGQAKVFYFGRQGSDGFLPSVEILGYSQTAINDYIKAFSVVPLFIAVNEPTDNVHLFLGLLFLIYSRVRKIKNA